MAEMAKLNGGRGVTYDADKLDLKGSDPKVVKAVRYAVAQAGNKPYVWATAGPDSFDCSGLMLAAYAKAGISLPHFSGAQAKLGHEVTEIKDLKPGDLIFFYSPIHHVGMYIGNGLFVHARNTRVGVVIQPLSSYDTPITMMRRIVG
jgi:cell wall-associated NlpC family hydrolase